MRFACSASDGTPRQEGLVFAFSLNENYLEVNRNTHSAREEVFFQVADAELFKIEQKQQQQKKNWKNGLWVA